ncbi:MAG TPA: hypothetical protein VJC13_01940 [Candidatus Paceibacterota bacterium]
MQELINSYKQSKNLHHAYFLVGDGEKIFSELKNFLEKSVGIKTSGNPDFWHGRFNSLTIDEAREIALAQERKSFAEVGLPQKKIFIIQADFISHEAQNSLLKVFEEPTAGTHFFIISPQDILLPTLRSRVHTINMARTPLATSMSRTVLDMKLAERLAKVKEIAEAIGDEESTKQDAISFLNEVEKELHEVGVEKSAKSLEVCQLARASLYDRGAPVKMILENVVLSI